MTFYAAILRLLLTTFITSLSLCRLDVCVMPRGLESFDSGPMSFMAMLYMHEQAHHPVLTEFIDALCVAGSPGPGEQPVQGATPPVPRPPLPLSPSPEAFGISGPPWI